MAVSLLLKHGILHSHECVPEHIGLPLSPSSPRQSQHGRAPSEVPHLQGEHEQRDGSVLPCFPGQMRHLTTFCSGITRLDAAFIEKGNERVETDVQAGFCGHVSEDDA